MYIYLSLMHWQVSNHLPDVYVDFLYDYRIPSNVKYKSPNEKIISRLTDYQIIMVSVFFGERAPSHPLG